MAGLNPATGQWDANYTAPNPFGFANQSQQANPYGVSPVNQSGGITSTGFTPSTNLPSYTAPSVNTPSVENAPFSAFATGTNNVDGGQTVGGAGAGSTNLETSFFDNFNLKDFSNAATGVSSLAGAWNGFQEAQTARDTLDFNRQVFERNFAEQKANQDRYYADRDAARAKAFM